MTTLASLIMASAGIALAPEQPSGPAAQPPAGMDLAPAWAARNFKFMVAGDDKRDMVSGNIGSGSMVGATVTPDGKTRCLTVSNTSGSGNGLGWPSAGTFTPGFTEILFYRRLGGSGGAYDSICGAGPFFNGSDSHGFLMNPGAGSRTYWAIKTGSTESGTGNGTLTSDSALEVVIAVFPAYTGGATSVTAKLYQGGVLTASRVMDSTFNKTFNPGITYLGTRGGNAGAPAQIAAYGFCQYEFTEADVAEWTTDFWSHFIPRA